MKYRHIKIVSFGLFALLFFGCNNNNGVYEKIYNKKMAKEPIECLKIISNNDIATYTVKKNQFIKSMLKESCPITLKITSHFITACTSSNAKALGSDFDGFLRFEFFKKDSLIYKNQRDFKGPLNKNVVKSLIKRAKERLVFVNKNH